MVLYSEFCDANIDIDINVINICCSHLYTQCCLRVSSVIPILTSIVFVSVIFLHGVVKQQ